MSAPELVVNYNPMPAAQRVSHYQAMLRSRLIWLAISGVILIAIWFWQRDELTGQQTVLLFVLGMSFSLIWVVIAGILLLRAQRSLAQVNSAQGVGVLIDRHGITVAGAPVDWPHVSNVRAVRPRFSGEPQLVVTDSAGGARAVPLSYLGAMPGTIDNAIRAYSGGRQWLDTTALGN